MKRLIIVLLVIAVAGIAGIVRSRTRAGGGGASLSRNIVDSRESSGDKREETRKSFELASGAKVSISGINGPVHISANDSSTAEVLIERFGKSQEALDRRTVQIESTPSSLTIRGKSGDVGLIARLFGSTPSEHITLKVPRNISLNTEGINGEVIVGELNGPIDVHGINGRIEIGDTANAVELSGINGNILVGLKGIAEDKINLHGINGNIEFRLTPGLAATFEAHGMNGNMASDLPGFVLENARHGNFTGRLGSGGNAVSAHGINGNIFIGQKTNATSLTSSGVQ